MKFVTQILTSCLFSFTSWFSWVVARLYHRKNILNWNAGGIVRLFEFYIYWVENGGRWVEREKKIFASNYANLLENQHKIFNTNRGRGLNKLWELNKVLRNTLCEWKIYSLRVVRGKFHPSMQSIYYNRITFNSILIKFSLNFQNWTNVT